MWDYTLDFHPSFRILDSYHFPYFDDVVFFPDPKILYSFSFWLLYHPLSTKTNLWRWTACSLRVENYCLYFQCVSHSFSVYKAILNDHIWSANLFIDRSSLFFCHLYSFVMIKEFLYLLYAYRNIHVIKTDTCNLILKIFKNFKDFKDWESSKSWYFWNEFSFDSKGWKQ